MPALDEAWRCGAVPRVSPGHVAALSPARGSDHEEPLAFAWSGAAGATSFVAAPKKAEHRCSEGYRCVSRVDRFGRNHALGKLVAALPEVGSDDYEWNCPHKGRWDDTRYDTNTEKGSGECQQPGDCLCIQKAALVGRKPAKGQPIVEPFSFLRDGQEQVGGKFMAEVGCLNEKKLLENPITIVPHYPMRDLDIEFAPEDIYADMGDMTYLPRDAFLDEYKRNAAPKMQASLDTLYHWLKKTYANNVEDKAFVCGPADSPDETPQFNAQEVKEALSKIRRFLILSQDCQAMNANINKIARLPQDKEFAPDGTFAYEPLNCYKIKDRDGCQQLNCYAGPEEHLFRSQLKMFRSLMEYCKPEADNKPGPSAAAAKEAKKEAADLEKSLEGFGGRPAGPAAVAAFVAAVLADQGGARRRDGCAFL